MKFNTLYARNKNGSVQEWTIEVIGNKFRTHIGQHGGLIIVSEWTICEGKNLGKKNETSPEKQAVLEAEAKFKKKIKEGYYENIKDIDFQNFFQVTLAKDFKNYRDKIDWKKGVCVQIKYNGGRMVAKKDGLFTRTGERYMSIPHIEEALKPFFEKYPDAILDGEVFNYELREELNEIMKLLRKTVHITPEDLGESRKKIKFYVYDGFGFSYAKKDADYLERKKYIDAVLATYDVVEFVPTWIVYSEKELEELYQKFLEDRQEGAILRIRGVGYEHGRTKNLLKFKPVDDDEFEVLDVEEGIGNRSGMAGKVVCKFHDGREFRTGVKGKEEQFIKLLKNKSEVIGKKVTIYYNGFTGLGLPNYAQFDCNNSNKGH